MTIHLMTLEKVNGQERDVLQVIGMVGMKSQVVTEFPVNRIGVVLKIKGIPNRSFKLRFGGY